MIRRGWITTLGVMPVVLSLTSVALAGGPTQDLDVVPVPVPEPSSLLFLATGLAGLGWMLRRRR